MKVSKRRIVTLFTFVIFILIQSVSLASTVLGEVDRRKAMEFMVKAEATLTQEEQETLDLINEYRRENGLADLKVFSKIQSVAILKAEDIVNNEYFSHTSESLGTPFEMLKENEISYLIAGENLAGNVTPEKAVEAWINSPLHRENILEDEFEYTGICVIESPVYGKVFVQLFIGIN